MKVIAAINGTIVAQCSAYLALSYAKKQGFDLLLLHIENLKDSVEDVHKSASVIEAEASKEGVSCETVFLKGHIRKAISAYLHNINVDMFFCSTRNRSGYINNSFSEHLLKMHLNTDIAVVRIVKIHHFKELDTLLLPIKNAKLSVKKFSFMATIASALKSEAEIYSVSLGSKTQLSTLSLSSIKNKLADINFELRHYVNLSRLIPLKLKIKHDLSINETQSILTHMARSEYQLVIIGAKRFSLSSLFQAERPIEKLLRETSVNLVAYYPKEH